MEKAHYEFPTRFDWYLTNTSNTKAKAPWSNPTPPTPPSRHFSPEEATEIKRIVLDLKERGFFLGGSRDKLHDHFSFDSTRDWDFNAPYFGARRAFKFGVGEDVGTAYELDGDEEVGKYVTKNFNNVLSSGDDYAFEDALFYSYWKHKVYPHITVIERANLPLYIRAWEALDINLWRNHIWKSRPELLKKGESPEEAGSRKNLAVLIFNSLYEACKDPNIEECM